MSATDTDGPTIAERYGRLVVLEYVGYRGDKQLVRCRECGAEVSRQFGSLWARPVGDGGAHALVREVS